MANDMDAHRRAHEALRDAIPEELVEAAAEAMRGLGISTECRPCPACAKNMARAALEVAQREWGKK